MIVILGNVFLYTSIFAVLLFYTDVYKKIINSHVKFINIIYLLSIIPFFLLVLGFGISDLSIINVFQNSYVDDPFLFKITSVWGSHEGSILLWIFLINIYGIIFLRKNTDKQIHKQTVFH